MHTEQLKCFMMFPQNTKTDWKELIKKKATTKKEAELERKWDYTMQH